MVVTVIAALCLLGLAPVLAALGGLVEQPSALIDVLGSGRTWSLWAGTMALGLATAGCCAALGVPVARCLARRGGGLAATLATLLPLPLILPPWVAGVSWTRLVTLNGFWGSTLLLSLSLWPLVALFALRGFRAHATAIDAARLDRGRGAAFRAVDLPLAGPSILAGMLLVFVFSITDFGVVDFLSFYDPQPFTVLSSEIFQQWSRMDRAAEAAAVSLPTIAPALLALWLVLRLERRHEGRLRGRGDDRPDAVPGRAAGSVGLLAVLLLMLAPLLVLITWTLRGGREAWATAWTASTRDSALVSVGTSLGAGLIVALLGVAVARVSLRHRRLALPVLALALLPLAAPSVMLGMGEVRFWNAPWNPLSDAVYLSPWLLVLATSGRFVALGALAARALLLRQDPTPDEAAALVPRPAWQRWLAVSLPRRMPALGLALALGYLLSMRELELVVTTPAGSDTLTHRIFSMVHIGSDEVTAALCLALVALVIVPAAVARLLGVPGVDCGPRSRGP